MDYECVVSMMSVRFRELLNTFLDLVSHEGYVKITWQRKESGDMVTFCGMPRSSGDIRSARFHYWTNPQSNTVVSCKTDSGKLHFNLRYLLSVLKATTMSTVVEVSLREQMPLKISYTVPEWSSGGDDGGLAFVVAPVNFEDESESGSEGE